MATDTSSLPRQWEDWCSWILGIWLCLSPWILQFSGEPLLTQNAVVVGFLLILSEVVTLSAFRPWEEWINIALGAWLIVSPFVLKTAALTPKADFVLVGLAVVALALYELWEVGRNSAPK